MSDEKAGAAPRQEKRQENYSKNGRSLKIAIAVLAVIILLLTVYSIVSIDSLNAQIESLQVDEGGLSGQLGGLQSQLFGVQQQLSSIASQVSSLGPHQVTNFVITEACVSLSTGCSDATVFYLSIFNTGNATLPDTNDYYVMFTDLRTLFAFGFNATTWFNDNSWKHWNDNIQELAESLQRNDFGYAIKIFSWRQSFSGRFVELNHGEFHSHTVAS
jgi:hypothetical protein